MWSCHGAEVWSTGTPKAARVLGSGNMHGVGEGSWQSLYPSGITAAHLEAGEKVQ